MKYYWINSDDGLTAEQPVKDTAKLVDKRGGLNIYVPTATALLAMKVVASRPWGFSEDGNDIATLLEITGHEADVDTLIELANDFMPQSMHYNFDDQKRSQLSEIIDNINKS